MTIFVMTISLLLAATTATAENMSNHSREECLTKNGEWIEPVNIDVREEDLRQPFCRCPRGSFFNGTTCLSTPNQTLCEASDGIWINGSCTCPESSIGFVSGVGCDYVSFPQSLEKSNHIVSTQKESKFNYSLVLILFMLILILSVWYLFKRLKK